jgi:cobalt-zinc-cadmium efflux system outer membrane protein
LPEPSVSVGWMGDIAPFTVQRGDPSSYRSVGAVQTIPFPGKRRLRAEMAGKEVQSAELDAEAVRRRLTAEVKSAYYDYWFYSKALQVTNRNKDLLQKLSEISEARYRVGKGLQQDVLRSQVEISLLMQKLTTLEQQRAAAQARLSTLMARGPDSQLPPAADIQQAAFNVPLEELYQLARRNDTELQRNQRLIERSQLAAGLARKDRLPDLSVGYTYQQRPLMPDMHGMMFTINVPVFYQSRQRAAIQEATEERISAERSRDNRQNELYFQLKQDYLAAKAGEQLLRLYSEGVVPQASLALESSMSAYQAGTADFQTMIGNFITVLNYETDYFRELANYQTALARLESLTGSELTNSPAAAADRSTR